MAKAATAPRGATVTMYDVGFGDSFLLTFEYSETDRRRILIDCGTSTKDDAQMMKVVEAIQEDCAGHLDAVVVTHRHLDHLSAFGSKSAGSILESLEPAVVVQPWTEHPDATAEAGKAPSVYGEWSVSHLTALATAQSYAERLVQNPQALLAAAGSDTRRSVSHIASLAIHNKAAVERLARMGRSHAYVNTGSESGLEGLLPGVTVTVLGPPTLEQSSTIKHQAKWDPDEMWKLHLSLAGRAAGNPLSQPGNSALFPSAGTTSVSRASSQVRWLTDKLDDVNLLNVRRLVEGIDDWVNNTSVILLFEFAGHALLFPGDAQVENWEFALGDAKLRKLLGGTTLYKVGHHGSRNATPQSLWKLFRKPSAEANRITTLLSTQAKVHEGVPCESLATALGNRTALHSSTDLRKERKLRETYEC